MLEGAELYVRVFFFQAEDGIRDYKVTGVQTCALPISCEPAEQGRKTFCGGRGGKGTDEGEHRSIAHAPDTEREAHVPGIGRCAESSKGRKAGAVHRSAPPPDHRVTP